MKKTVLAISISAIIFSLIVPQALAHQPRLTFTQNDSDSILLTEIEKPEISKAYYGELKEKVDLYEFTLETEQEFYFNILVPDIEGATPNFSADLILGNNPPLKIEDLNYLHLNKLLNGETKQITTLDGLNFKWTKFYEEFAGDDYLKGPEEKVLLQPGTYLIKVYNPGNTGKYVLATGDIESFPLAESLRTLRELPTLKSEFFGKSPISMFYNVIGMFLGILVLIIVVIIVSAILLIKKFKKGRHLAKKK